MKVRAAEAVAPPLSSLVWHTKASRVCRRGNSRTPTVATQLRALAGRALLNVARDPYLAALHVVLTPLVGLLVGSMFGDLRRLNEETAGVQVGSGNGMYGNGVHGNGMYGKRSVR